jgi:catechol 2,3-dioxygenase-like lactoylglutathione lyase family enzyme
MAPEGRSLYVFKERPMTERSSSLSYVAPVFRVADLARSLSYYRDRLGFEVEFNYEGFYACVLRDGCRIHLKCSDLVGRDEAAFEAAEHLDACFRVQDAQDLASRFASAGAAISLPLRTMPYGREFYVKDPDGYILGFVQPTETQNA